MTTRKKKKATPPTFDIRSIIDGVGDATYIHVSGNGLENCDVFDGDLLLCDHQRKPRKGDVVAFNDGDGVTLARYNGSQKVWAVAIALIRDFRAKPRRQKRRAKADPKLTELKHALSKLERLPENESERFKLETEIYRAAHESDTEEWPELIGS